MPSRPRSDCQLAHTIDKNRPKTALANALNKGLASLAPHPLIAAHLCDLARVCGLRSGRRLSSKTPSKADRPRSDFVGYGRLAGCDGLSD